MMKKYYILFLLLIFTSGKTLAQSVEQNQFKLAQSYESSGKLEDASRLYFELLQKSPNNAEYLISWFRVTKQLNKYSELLEYLQNRIVNFNDFTTNLLIAETYWLKGKPDEANSAWTNAKKLAKTTDDYTRIAQSMVSVRQFQKAIDVYLDARKQFNQTRLFSNELIKLYTAIGQYPEATDEILNDAKVSNNLQVAQGRLYALMINEDAKKYLKDRIEQEYAPKKSSVIIQLYIWFNRTLGDYEKAFEATIVLDKIFNQNFNEIYRFANQSRADGQYDIALKAYAYIIEKSPKDNYNLPTYLYGYALTLEQKLNSTQTRDLKELEKVKEIYQKIIKDFPNTPQQFDGFYRLAQISLELDNNPAKAIEYLSNINEKYGLTELYFSAKNELSRVYLFQEEFQKAKNVNLELINKIPNFNRDEFQEEINKALFNIAKIHYYHGQIDSAKTYLDIIKITSNSLIANDYLSFYSFLTNNENLNAAIRAYAKGEFYQLIKKYDLAIENFDKATKFGQGSELEELSILNIAEIKTKTNQLDEALQIYNNYLDKFPKSIYIDEVYLKMGNIYQLQSKPELAETTYTKILVNFPKSIYYEEARKQIREIRNNRVP